MEEKCHRCGQHPVSRPFYRDAWHKAFVPGWCRQCVTEYENSLFLVSRVHEAEQGPHWAIIHEARAARAKEKVHAG